ncbi:MAG: hypothetical protein AAFR76_01575 [Planctomycetota bacterium]
MSPRHMLHIGVDPGLPGALAVVDGAARLQMAASWWAVNKEAHRITTRLWWADADMQPTALGERSRLSLVGDWLACGIAHGLHGHVATLTCEELFVKKEAGGGAPILLTEWYAASICVLIEHACNVPTRRVRAVTWRAQVYGRGGGGLDGPAAKRVALQRGPGLVSGLAAALDACKPPRGKPPHHLAEAAMIAKWGRDQWRHRQRPHREPQARMFGGGSR